MRTFSQSLFVIAALAGCAPVLAQTPPPAARPAPVPAPAPAARPPATPATPAVQGRPRLTEACAQSIQRFCPQVAIGQGRVTRCLMRRKNQLQRSCRLFIRRLSPAPR